MQATSVQCWSPQYPDQMFTVEFGDWKMIGTWPPFTVFTNETERLIWCWNACSGVRTDLEITPKATEITLVNGAAFIIRRTEAVHIVPLLLDPLESNERRAQRRPPATLPSDVPFVRARLLVAPIASDTHAPLLTIGNNVYRLV